MTTILQNETQNSAIKKLFFKIMFVVASVPPIVLIGMSLLAKNASHMTKNSLTTALFYIPVIIILFIISLFKGKKAFSGAVLGFISALVISLGLLIIMQFLVEYLG
jgi:hypothetical protein